MFYRILIKWSVITFTVMAGFLVVLLLLGYLLKENEATTTKLKAKLEAEAYQQQKRKNRQENSALALLSTLSSFEKSQQKIIAENNSCQSDKECFLVHTHSQAIGCIVAVNTLGATILLKVASAQQATLPANNCHLIYSKETQRLAQCRNERCTF